LKDIVSWLQISYPNGIKLAGVICLYEICLARDLFAARKRLDEFNALCKDRATKNVILATTKWTTPPTAAELKRESQLEGPDHWGQLIRHGSRMRRLSDDTFESAWMLVKLILADAFTFDIETDRISDEMKRSLEKKKDIDGQPLIDKLRDLFRLQNSMASELRQSDGGDQVLWQRLVDNDKQIRNILYHISTKVPLSQKIKAFFKIPSSNQRAAH